jgi:hypothetical protein
MPKTGEATNPVVIAILPLMYLKVSPVAAGLLWLKTPIADLPSTAAPTILLVSAPSVKANAMRKMT